MFPLSVDQALGAVRSFAGGYGGVCREDGVLKIVTLPDVLCFSCLQSATLQASASMAHEGAFIVACLVSPFSRSLLGLRFGKGRRDRLAFSHPFE